MKRGKAIVLLLIFTLFLGAFQTGAAQSNIIFTAVNDTLLPLSDSTMPVWFYDTPYIPYSVFTNNFDISSSFDQANNRLTLFNPDYVITFDLNLNFSYDSSRTAFLEAAQRHNSTIYVPARFTANKLGLYSTYFENGPLVRVKTPFSISDNRFISSVSRAMVTQLERYLGEQSAPVSPGESPSEPVSPRAKRPIYLVFSGVPSSSAQSILDDLDLRGIKATFVLDGENIAQNEEIVRRIAVAGHSIGLGGRAAADAGFYTNSTTMIGNLADQNQLLRLILKTETRIVLPSGSDVLNPAMAQILAAKGYRLWRTTYHPEVGEKDNAQTFYQNTVRALSSLEDPLIMKLTADGLTADALPSILDWLRANDYSFHKISETDTPPPDAPLS